jgi:signal transduction histidine kinase
MLSHDFRTPMAVIQSSAGLLRDYTDRLTEEKKRIHLEKIQIQIKQLVSMLDDTLILMKAQTIGIQFEPKPLDVAALCQAIVKEIQQTTTKHQIAFDSSKDCGEALLDEKLMRQIITNLLSNAVKYSPKGGTVSFDLRCENDEIILKIKDAGIGIPEADQANLFEAFRRARNVGDISGTGLGLAIVKQAVDAHGGSITFDSKMGVGTTFVVTLPNPL